jgi:mono/diheme cytochrome c family protein
MVRIALTAAAALVACGWPMVSHADGDAADVEAGRALFMQKGYYECHGIFGQGSIATGPYTVNCAACHGQNGEGGVGPTLIGISNRYQTANSETRIREPHGIMPKLYPNPLNAKDVQDVASLK